MFEKLNDLKHLSPKEFDAELGKILETAMPKAKPAPEKKAPEKKSEKKDVKK